MKVNELMIGDWVQDKYMHVKFQIFKISGKTVNHAPHSDSGFLEEEIEPISITPEILEKNGFNEEEGVDGLICHVGDAFIEYSIDGSDLFLVSNWRRYYDGELRYVHELQHALRLCKIDKEIEL